MDRGEAEAIYDQGDMRRVIEQTLGDQRPVQLQQALKAYGQPSPSELQAMLSLAKSRL